MSAKADQLRAALKTAGFNARRVTVRHDQYSMGSSIYVTIRDASVSIAEVKRIAAGYERVARCESSGEILSGGNTFLHVDYDRRVSDPVRAEIAAALAAAAPGEVVALAEGVRGARNIPGSSYGSTACLWLGSGDAQKQINCYDEGSLANVATEHVLEARAAQAARASAELAS